MVAVTLPITLLWLNSTYSVYQDFPIYFAPVSVCLSVCLSARFHISETTRSNFSNFSTMWFKKINTLD